MKTRSFISIRASWRRFSATCLGFGLLLVIVVANNVAAQEAAQAQSKDPTVNIPFEFMIGGMRLPAGEYVVQAVTQNMFVIKSKDGKSSEEVFTLPDGDGAAGEPKLVFIVYDGKHFLSEVWTGNAKSVVTTEYPNDSEKQLPRQEVPIAYR
jgi:hypothetical protein